MKHYTELDCWNVGIELLEEIYRLTKKFPKEERYGMTSQVQKSAVSILANIAEGFSRYTYPDKANRYVIARGESSEVEALLFVAVAVGHLKKENITKALELIMRERKLLSGLINACRSRS